VVEFGVGGGHGEADYGLECYLESISEYYCVKTGGVEGWGRTDSYDQGGFGADPVGHECAEEGPGDPEEVD
jgi:hypothetical protein